MSDAFIVTDPAATDLADVWQYLTDEAGELVADRYLARIHTACKKLAAMPGIGHYREDLLDRQYRFWLVGSHLLVYRWQAKPIQIIRVLHAARDLSAVYRKLRLEP
jgi:plasmid stabilization system protein ParE